MLEPKQDNQSEVSDPFSQWKSRIFGCLLPPQRFCTEKAQLKCCPGSFLGYQMLDSAWLSYPSSVLLPPFLSFLSSFLCLCSCFDWLFSLLSSVEASSARYYRYLSPAFSNATISLAARLLSISSAGKMFIFCLLLPLFSPPLTVHFLPPFLPLNSILLN